MDALPIDSWVAVSVVVKKHCIKTAVDQPVVLEKQDILVLSIS